MLLVLLPVCLLLARLLRRWYRCRSSAADPVCGRVLRERGRALRGVSHDALQQRFLRQHTLMYIASAVRSAEHCRDILRMDECRRRERTTFSLDTAEVSADTRDVCDTIEVPVQAILGNN